MSGFIIFASVSNASVGKLFIAGILPGILLGGILIINCYIIAVRNKFPKGEKLSVTEIRESFKDAFWSLLMPVIIIGGIVSGVVTATEAGVIAIIYGLIVGLFIHKTLKLKDLLSLFIRSAKATARIMIIIACASAFGWIISREVDPQLIVDTFSNITTNKKLVLTYPYCCFSTVGNCNGRRKYHDNPYSFIASGS